MSGSVAIVSHSHPSISKGGAEISAYALFRGLREIGYDAIYIAACPLADRARLALGGDKEFAVYFEHQQYSSFYHVGDTDVVRQLRHIFEAQDARVVNFHHFLHLGLNSLRLAHRTMGLRCYLTLHEFLAICHHHGQMVTRPQKLLCSQPSNEACASCFPEHSRTEFLVRKKKMLETFGEFEGFVSPSRFLAERFVDWGLNRSRVAVIENGLLTHRDGETASTPQDAGHRRLAIGFFGQINPFKGVDVILDAAELISQDAAMAQNVEIRIHGNLVGQSAAFLSRFEDAVKRHRFLSFVGPYNSSVVADLMGRCDFVLVPSLWWENSPVVIQESFAVGVPVICTGIGGMAEKVPAGVCGLHFSLGDPQSLVNVIRQALLPGTAEKLRLGVPKVHTASGMAKSYASFMKLGEELTR